MTWYLNRVFSPYPEYFGKPSKEQRNRWSEQLRWAMTIALSRAFGPRYPGAPFAMFVFVDTWVGSSVSPSLSLPLFVSCLIPGDGTTLIPGIDVLNHNINGSIARHTMASVAGSPAIVAYSHRVSKPTQAGEELFACYVKPPDDGACNDLMFQSCVSL